MSQMKKKAVNILRRILKLKVEQTVEEDSKNRMEGEEEMENKDDDEEDEENKENEEWIMNVVGLRRILYFINLLYTFSKEKYSFVVKYIFENQTAGFLI